MEKGIRASADAMVRAMRGILSGGLHSLWLYGSVALDDFRPGWSDVDFIALTNAPVPEAEAGRLLTLRQELSGKEPGNPYYRCFEGVILPLAEYRDRAPVRLVYWGTTGQRVTDRLPEDPFARYELAKYGECVYGDGDRGIFAEPGMEELTAAIRLHYKTIRKYAVQTDESLYSCGWLLDMARCVYTLRFGDVIAKTRAGVWALEAHIFPGEEALEKTLLIRRDPLKYRDRPEVRRWLAGLGPTVQRYADALERELEAAAAKNGENR